MNSFRTCTTSLYLGSSVRRLSVILMLLAWSEMDARSDIVKNNQNNNINNELERTWWSIVVAMIWPSECISLGSAG